MGGSEVSEVTHSAAKRHTRHASRSQAGSSGSARSIASSLSQTLSFSSSESTRLLYPHHDALDMSLFIENCLIKCILIDNGSSANVMFLGAFREMGLDESKIVKLTTVLIGFSGEHKSTVGEIDLPIYAESVNLCTHFLVVDSPSFSYNVILGHPWIHEMEAVPSTFH